MSQSVRTNKLTYWLINFMKQGPFETVIAAELFQQFIDFYGILLFHSLVGIVTGYGLDDQGGGSSSPGSVKNFHSSISSRPALGSTQPPTKWVPGVKRQRREADHSLPTSAEVKKMWIYTSTRPYVFMA
jgi:hypothetical protein